MSLTMSSIFLLKLLLALEGGFPAFLQFPRDQTVLWLHELELLFGTLGLEFESFQSLLPIRFQGLPFPR